MSIVVAVTGVSSLLGENLLEILESRTFPIARLVLTDPGQVVGRSVMFAGHATRIVSVNDADFSDVDIVFNCRPDALPAMFNTTALIGTKLRVIDLCPVGDSDAPCIVPEINADQIETSAYLISPCSAAIVSALALSAIHQRFKLLRLNVVSLCSVAESGEKGVKALASETAKLLNGRDPEASYYGQQIAFNLIPQTGTANEDGHTDTETLLAMQLQKVLGDEALEIAVTSVQLPLFHGQNVVLHAECQFPVDLSEAQLLLSQSVGVQYAPDQQYSVVTNAAGQDEVFISRLRTEADNNASLMLCAVSDSLRKGGALNAVQIAEHLLSVLDH